MKNDHNRRARVLIVDDDERNLLALKTVIEDVAEVVTASSGEEALRHLLKDDFAAILLDVFMPIMDGYETAGLIRQREQSKRIPIIFLSAVNKEDAHLMRGYAMGAVDYVFKPVEPVVLRSKVAVFVDLYEKTCEIQRKAAQEQKLRDENIRVQQERLITEQALRRAEERQALILSSLPIVLYLEALEASPRVPHYVSGDLKAMTGFAFDDVQREPTLWADRLHPDDRERVLAARAAASDTAAMALEYRWQAADGDYRHFLEHAVVLYGADGRPTEIAGTLFDVTSQRHLENQLGHAQKMDAVGKLTGGIAHDFNNLLAAVIGGIGLIERRVALDEAGRQVIDMTRHAAEQGAELVKRLLAFARRQELRPSAVPIDRLATNLRSLLAHTLGGLIEMEWTVEPDVSAALADENQLELALMNLIINARDAMPDGGLVSIIAANRQLEGTGQLPAGEYVVFTVRDNGIGIAPELLSQIFEPFMTTKDVGKGTGLGLSMVYGFAQQSGGCVQVESTPGMGATFELWLPSVQEMEREPHAGATAQSPDFSSAIGRILLVDDHDGVRSVTQSLLLDLGHDVIGAESLASALEILRHEQPFDLLVTDYAMPRGSGTDLIRHARQLHPKLRAIIMTGYVDGEMIANRPADTIVLKKPASVEDLSAAIQQALAVQEVKLSASFVA